MVDDSRDDKEIQEPIFLDDRKPNGKKRPWKEKKEGSGFLRDSYIRIGNSVQAVKIGRKDYYFGKARRANSCAQTLIFKYFEDGNKKLKNALFCQMPLCPMCSWRRQLKIRAQVSKVAQALQEDGYNFVFLHLTIENVEGKDLNATLDAMAEGIRRLFLYKQVKHTTCGFFRALEITHDKNETITKAMYDYKDKSKYYDKRGLKIGDVNPNYGKYHPHYHVMIAVLPRYFKEYYFKQHKWTDMWIRALKISYNPIVYVTLVNEENMCKKRKKNVDPAVSAVLEVAKYPLKDTDYIIREDEELTDEVVIVLDRVLHHRRLIGFGGVFKLKHKQLNLDDEVDADVHITEDDVVESLHYLVAYYTWHVGFKNYVLVKLEEKEEIENSIIE